MAALHARSTRMRLSLAGRPLNNTKKLAFLQMLLRLELTMVETLHLTLPSVHMSIVTEHWHCRVVQCRL